MNGVRIIKNYKILIINATPGAGSHKLGRIISCFDNIYWYSHPWNGNQPWEVSIVNEIKEIYFSKYHYDRVLPDDSVIPLIGSRIEKYWDNRGWFNNWYKIMETLSLPDKYLVIVAHDSPQMLRDLFPTSLIVNLLEDPAISAKRHLALSMKYRIDYKLKNQIPTYKSKWVLLRDDLLKINPAATEKDLWMYTNNSNENEYKKTILEEIEHNYNINITEQEFADINVCWETFNPRKYEYLLGKLNPAYEELMDNEKFISSKL